MYKKFIQATSVLALAGSVLAAPAPQQTIVEVVTHTAVHTVVVEAGSAPTAQAAPPAPPAPAPKPSPKPTVVVHVPEPQPTEDSKEETAPTGSSGSGYINVVSKWRQVLGLPPLSEDFQLQNNAQKTVNDGQGVMHHQLNDGSMAQVLAMGASDAFEKVFVGGWLCERPNLQGLDQVCNALAGSFDHQRQTGHADILVNTAYSKIGCANSQGVWSCDLA